MKKYIKKIVSFVMCFVMAISILFAAVMMPASTIRSEAAAITNQTAQDVYRFLVCTMGFTPASACGIMANIHRESGFRLNALGDGGTSYGLCQWHDTDTNIGRMTALFNFCDKNGYDVNSVEGQMRYLESELKGSGYQDTYRMLSTATNDLDGVHQAAYYWCIWFERPADRYTKGEERATFAQTDYWPVYGTISGINTSTVSARSVTETSAIISGSVYKPLDTNIEACGIYFGKDQTNMTRYQNTVFDFNSQFYGKTFDFYTDNGGANPTLGVVLEKNTTYYYQFYCVVAGVEYKGAVNSFTTKLYTQALALSDEEIDIDFNYKDYYEIAYEKDPTWSMPPVTITAMVTPSDSTDKVKWTSSDTAVATVVDGVVYAHNNGVATITATSGNYSKSCKVYVGKISEPEVIIRSKNQGTMQDVFALGDTIEISPVQQQAAGCYRVTARYENETTLLFECYLSVQSNGKWSLTEKYDFVPTKPGKYTISMMMANGVYLETKDVVVTVLDHSDKPVDSSVEDTGTVSEHSLGKLTGISMSLDGYLVVNYYVLPTENSRGASMGMQFTVSGQTQYDDDYEIEVVGNTVAYKYECKIAASELTESINAKLILGNETEQLRNISANDYCKNILAGADSNTSYARAASVVKALMNYCGYAQIYFGKNTENIANSGLYSGVGSDVNPVLSGGLADVVDNGSYFAAYINGASVDPTAVSNGELTLNGITYLGATLTLNSGTGLNLYYRLPSNMTETDLAGYTISIDGVGNISFVRSNTNFNTTVSDGSDESVGGEDADVEETDSEAVAADIEETDSEAVSTEVEEAECENIAEEAEVAEPENVDDIDAVISENPEETVEDTSEDVEEDYTETDQDDVVVMQVGVEENLTEEAPTIANEAEEAAEDNEIVSVSVEIDNKTAITYTLSNNILCISLVNISADKLGDVYSFKLKDAANNSMQINYSPIKYMIDMQNNGSDNGINLVRSLYLYYKAVEAYKG